ncbi:hypothetical protein GCM10029978_067800 [Actinoallomurus acanthiterrae]
MQDTFQAVIAGHASQDPRVASFDDGESQICEIFVTVLVRRWDDHGPKIEALPVRCFTKDPAVIRTIVEARIELGDFIRVGSHDLLYATHWQQGRCGVNQAPFIISSVEKVTTLPTITTPGPDATDTDGAGSAAPKSEMADA